VQIVLTHRFPSIRLRRSVLAQSNLSWRSQSRWVTAFRDRSAEARCRDAWNTPRTLWSRHSRRSPAL